MNASDINRYITMRSGFDQAERREKQRLRKKAQRIRDKKPGARHEKTYRATDEEHKVLKKTLIELRR